MPAGRNSHLSVSRVPAPSGSKAYSQCTQPLLTCHANLRPGSAATTWLRVSHVRSGVSLRPGNHPPTCGPPPSSPQPALQIGPHSPILVTSDTSAYRFSGGTATEIESDNVNSVTSRVCHHAAIALSTPECEVRTRSTAVERPTG